MRNLGNSLGSRRIQGSSQGPSPVVRPRGLQLVLGLLSQRPVAVAVAVARGPLWTSISTPIHVLVRPTDMCMLPELFACACACAACWIG